MKWRAMNYRSKYKGLTLEVFRTRSGAWWVNLWRGSNTVNSAACADASFTTKRDAMAGARALADARLPGLKAP